MVMFRTIILNFIPSIFIEVIESSKFVLLQLKCCTIKERLLYTWLTNMEVLGMTWGFLGIRLSINSRASCHGNRFAYLFNTVDSVWLVTIETKPKINYSLQNRKKCVLIPPTRANTCGISFLIFSVNSSENLGFKTAYEMALKDTS